MPPRAAAVALLLFGGLAGAEGGRDPMFCFPGFRFRATRLKVRTRCCLLTPDP
jgi:hypothetical protein